MRVKRGVSKHKRKRKIIKMAKGYRGSRRHRFKMAKQAVIRAGLHTYIARRLKKRDFRNLWIIKINAGLLNETDLSYSQFIHLLKKNKIELDRKILADLAENEPAVFKDIVAAVK